MLGYEPASVLPTRGNTELLLRLRQFLLRQCLFGEHGGDSIRSLVAQWSVEQDKFLDLAQLFQQALIVAA